MGITKEEAIKYGTEWLKDEYLDAKDGAFIKMAIEALKLIPDNATNGDVIKTLFPDESDFETGFDTEWWNAPYEAEREVKDDKGQKYLASYRNYINANEGR